MRNVIKPHTYGNGKFFWKFQDGTGNQIILTNMQYTYYLHLANKTIVNNIQSIKKSLQG